MGCGGRGDIQVRSVRFILVRFMIRIMLLIHTLHLLTFLLFSAKNS